MRVNHVWYLDQGVTGIQLVKTYLWSNKKSPVALNIQACISSIKPTAMKDYSRIS